MRATPRATGTRALVIGAGPGGLAAAAALQARGVEVLVLDRAGAVGSSWRGHYDRLRLHTPRELSGLPGYAIPRRFGRWVPRDGVVAYLEEYAEHHGLRVRTGAEVARVDRAGTDDADGWVVRLADGEELRAEDVVVATGYNHTPRMPRWPGDEEFAGEIVHASDYRNGVPWAGRRALVVGIGNTGAEIATDLADHGAQPVWIAVRTAPYILARDRGPVLTATLTGVLVRRLPPRLVDLLQDRVLARDLPDLTEHGLARPTGGIYSQVLRGTIPVQDVGIVAAIRAGRVRPVAGPARFGAHHVELVDGTRLDAEVVVVAAGYARGLEPLVGHLGVLDGSGSPRTGGGREALPGLWFTGFTNPISGMFRELRIDAGRIARRVARRHRPRT